MCMRQIVGNESRYEFIEAGGGEEGLRLAREKRPDVIILDLQMPTVDGFTVLQQLGADERTSMIPVIVSTSMTIDATLSSRLPDRVRLISKNTISRENVSLFLRDAVQRSHMSAGEKIVVLNVDDLEAQRYVKTRDLKPRGLPSSKRRPARKRFVCSSSTSRPSCCSTCNCPTSAALRSAPSSRRNGRR